MSVVDGGDVAGFVGDAGLRLRQRGGLRRTDQVVQRALLLAEAAVDRERAGDVGRIAAVFGAGIDQHQVAVVGRRIVGAVVQHAGIAAGADDAAVGRFGIVLAEHALDLGLQFVLAHAGTHRAHRGFVRAHADVGGALHQLQFVAVLEQSHLVEQVAQLEEFMRRLRALAHHARARG